jgi:hypothetical protein
LAHNVGHNFGCQHNIQSAPVEENTIGFGYQVRSFDFIENTNNTSISISTLLSEL